MVTSCNSPPASYDAPFIPRAIAKLSLNDDRDAGNDAHKPNKKHKDAAAAIDANVWDGNPGTPSSTPGQFVRSMTVPLLTLQPSHHTVQTSHGDDMVAEPQSDPVCRGPKVRKRLQVHSPAVSGSTANRDGGEAEEDAVGSTEQVMSALRAGLSGILTPDVTRALHAASLKQPDEATTALKHKVRAAKQLLARGSVVEATAVADALCLEGPDSPDVLCLKGSCLAAAGQYAGAYASFALALSLDDSHVDSHMACGMLHNTCGDMVNALRSFKRALAVAPDDGNVQLAMATTLTNLGTQYQQSGKLADAVQQYTEALAILPTHVPALYNQAVTATAQDNRDEAKKLYHSTLELEPNHCESLCNLGVLYQEQGDLAKAVSYYERAWSCQPTHALIKSNLATALLHLGTKQKENGDHSGAVARYERALAVQPHMAEAMYNLGVEYAEQGLTDRSIFMYEMAVAVNPRCAEAWNNLGVMIRERGDLEHAAHCYQQALNIRPNFPQALNNLAVMHTSQGRAREAYSLLRAAILADATYAEAYNNLGVLLPDLGMAAEAVANYEKCMKMCPDARNAGQNRLLALNYLYHGEDPFICNAHMDWGRKFAATISPLEPPITAASYSETDRFRRLKVGYISPDLFTHSVSYFAEAPLRHHDASAVELYVYSCVVKEDSKTSHLKAAVSAAGGKWHCVTAISESELAQRIREDDIDVLIELTGHTAHNRLGTLARRPAPVQITWIGYPNTTGLTAVDYRFTDAICDPLSTTQVYAEELVRLPTCFLCYTPALAAPDVAPLPAIENGFITFASFNNLGKVTSEVMRLWARVLAAVPHSRLLLKSKPFACETSKRHYLELLRKHGVRSSSVDLLPLTPGTREHLEVYALADISLDPFPYAGTTTTAESLYMGVPCITLRGKCHAHNVGCSLLSAVGLGSRCVAESPEQYVRLAAQLASDVEALSRLRAKLRLHMLASPLCDGPKFVQELEAVYRRLWHRFLDGRTSDNAHKDHAASHPCNAAATQHPLRTGSGHLHCKAHASEVPNGVSGLHSGTCPKGLHDHIDDNMASASPEGERALAGALEGAERLSLAEGCRDDGSVLMGVEREQGGMDADEHDSISAESVHDSASRRLSCADSFRVDEGDEVIGLVDTADERRDVA